ncbi:hypothetical protein TMatcc_004578 [Talaromyces marneffei ATCC 18224]
MEHNRDDDEKSEKDELNKKADDDNADGILGFGVGHHAASYIFIRLEEHDREHGRIHDRGDLPPLWIRNDKTSPNTKIFVIHDGRIKERDAPLRSKMMPAKSEGANRSSKALAEGP